MSNHKKILITGANGFIGSYLCVFLKEKGYFVRGAVRNNTSDIFGVDEYIQVADINELTDWTKALQNIDFVVHLAGRAHIMNERKSDSAAAYHRVNVLGTKRLAEQSAKAGVKRFIFISSIKVNGEVFNLPYTEEDTPNPQDAYGFSKLEAEKVLLNGAFNAGFNTVILRVSLVYGPGVRSNFKNLIKIASSGLPLPFKGINNRRSFLYLGNLADAIFSCIEHPLAAGETFLVSDGQDVSTPDLIKMIACAMKKKMVLFFLFPGILKALCKIFGKMNELEKLTGSLFVDSSKIRNLLNWNPPFTFEEGIRETVKKE